MNDELELDLDPDEEKDLEALAESDYPAAPVAKAILKFCE
jgi:hypothetical protein